MTLRRSASSEASNRNSPSTRVAAALAVFCGLAWFLLVQVQAFGCTLGGSAGDGSAGTADLPCLALCAFGVALWRRSRWAVVLAPAPLGLGTALHLAAWLAPRALSFARCALSVDWVGPFRTDASLFLFFAVAIPGMGVVALWRAAPATFERAWEMVPSRRTVWLILAGAIAASVVAISVRRPLPFRLGEDFDDFSHSLPRNDQVSAPDLRDRLQIAWVMFTRLDGGQAARLGPLLEERLGPIEWMTHTTDPDKRYVTATGHFAPAVWHSRFDARVIEFDHCLGAIGGSGREQNFIQDFSDWWHGRLTGQQVNEKWWPGGRDVFEREIEKYQRGELRPEEIQMRWFSRGPGNELYNKLLNCAQATPSMSEEEFSRVVLQWRCSGLECSWIFIDPDAWSRVLPAPCRDAGARRCVAEAMAYLTTGALAPAPASAPRDRARER